MNKIIRAISGVGVVILTLMLTLSVAPKESHAQGNVSISFQTFYDDLAPYGTWYNDPQYGYVWSPNAGRGFRPYYTNGYWVMTEYGNMWVSNYPWGWAPFHYGRWAYSDYYGWIWIPDTQWGPAWVVWREGGGYYGWAPMGPGMTISMSFGSGYYPPNYYWTFIPYNYIYSRSFHRHYAPRRSRSLIRNTRVLNNTYQRSSHRYVAGPRRSDIERRVGRSVDVYQVGPRRSAGHAAVSGRQVSVYRPQVSHNSRSNAAPRSVKKTNRPLINARDARSNDQNGATRAVPANRARTQDRNTNNTRRQPDVRPTEREPVRRVQPRQQQRVERRATPTRVERSQPKAQPQRSAPSRDKEPVRRINRTERAAPAPERREAKPARRVAPQRAAPAREAAPERRAEPRRSSSRSSRR